MNEIVIVNKNYYGPFLCAVKISDRKLEIFGFNTVTKAEIKACLDKILNSPQVRSEEWASDKRIYSSKKVSVSDALFPVAIGEGLNNEGYAAFILEDFQKDIYREILDESMPESDKIELLASLPFSTKKID